MVQKMKLIDSLAKWLPTIVAICGLVSLYVFWQIDGLVHVRLYDYGLIFSNDWAMPYWTAARVGWVMCGLVVVLAIVSQLYLLRQKPVEGMGIMQPQSDVRDEDRWSTFRLGDGSTIKVKLVVKGAKRLNKFSADGMPVYTVDTEPIVRVVEVPESLRVPASSS